jgi:O-antigen ligase
LGWDEHLYRMFGQFLDTSIAGGIYGILFIAVLQLQKTGKIKIIFLLLTFSAVLLTFSRLTFISLIITCLVYFIKNKQLKYLIVFLLAFGLGIMLLPKPVGEGVNLLRTVTLESRARDYEKAFGYWLKSPLFGYGYNRIRYLQPQTESNLHSGASFSSSYLIVLVSTGILGLLLFLKLLFDMSRINLFAYYGIIFLSLISLGDNIILHPLVIFIYGSLILFFVSHR